MKEMPCPVCGESSFRTIWHFDDIANGCCASCGHVYSILSNSKIDNYQGFEQKYPDDYLIDEQNEIFAIAHQRFSYVPELSGCALEIGCGYGHFLHLLKKAGMTVFGLEPSQIQSEFSRKYFGLEVEPVVFDNMAGTECDSHGSFDLITAFHVLEHVSDIGSFLSKVYDYLGDDGHFMVAVPDLETLPVNFTELYFIARGWHRHTFQSPHLVWLLESSGFNVKEKIDEKSTIMSPSSMLFVCQKGKKSPYYRLPPSCDCGRIEEFHNKLEQSIIKIKEKVRSWLDSDKKIAFYGGGLHTEAVLSLSGLGKDKISCIIDDDSRKHGRCICEVPIVSADSDKAKNCDVVVVSSLASENYLVPKLRQNWQEKMIVGFYMDLFDSEL